MGLQLEGLFVIKVECSGCGRRLNAPDKLAGKNVACPKCSTPVAIPNATQSSATPSAIVPESIAEIPVPTQPVAVDSEPASLPPAILPVASAPNPVPIAPVAVTSDIGIGIDTGVSKSKTVRAVRRKNSGSGLFAIGALTVAAVVGGIAGFMLFGTATPELTLLEIADQSITEHQGITIDVPPINAVWRGRLRYQLKEPLDGATIDAKTGRFTWTPSEQQGSANYQIVIHAEANGVAASETFTISVAEHNSRPAFDNVEKSVTAIVGQPLQVQLIATDSDDPAAKLRYELANELAVGATINPDTGVVDWTPDESVANNRIPIRVKAIEQGDNGHEVLTQIVVTVRMPVEPAEAPSADAVAAVELPESPEFDLPAMSEETTTEPPVDLSFESQQDGGKSFDPVAALYINNILFKDNSYLVLRKYFADQFEHEHQASWRTALGEEAEELDAWLAENVDLKEELFTAIDPQYDNIPEVFRVFNAIRTGHPDRINSYGNLAIATALVWDDPKGGVYDYGNHCRRCKSTMPIDRPDALANFEYFLHAEKFMQGRGQFLPWEFLIHLVNHRTPYDERKWALGGYLGSRAMFGKCYKDVPYDTEMLDSGSAVARMNTRDYTLPNLKQFGGVCAMQADYAARVGKSLGVPAAYVSGENRYGGLHAWVMWVELQSVTATSIGFKLESYGRYRGDKYYVGNLRDPQTGQRITDRQLELRFHAAGTNTRAKRHAELLLAAMPLLDQREAMDINSRLLYLSSVLQLSPGNEDAWRATGALASEPEVQEKRQKQMRGILDQFFRTFGNFPDFTWEVFDDLIAFETDEAKRLDLYNRLSLLYVAAERPDLACEARIKLADLLVQADKHGAAIEGLAVTIQHFPDEGRYVPRMLDKLEATCEQVEGADQQLLAFYNTFIPRIPKLRGSRPSEYCIEMYERAIAKCQQHNALQAAQVYQFQLEQLKAKRS